MFNYGTFKLFIFKICFGALLLSISVFFILSLVTHNPADPGIGKVQGNDASNLFGFVGALSSSFLIMILGKLSLMVVIYLFYWGALVLLGIKTNRMILKFFLILLSVILINLSLSLQNYQTFQNILLTKVILDILLFYLPVIENYSYVLSFFFFGISLFFTMYCFSIKTKYLTKVFLKVFLLKKIFKNFTLSKKIKDSQTIRTQKRSEPTIIKQNVKLNIFNKNNKKQDGLIKKEDEYSFNLPKTDFLIRSKTNNSDKKELNNTNKLNSKKLEKILGEYGVEGKVVGFKTGPIVTLFEFVPNAGIKASKIIGLSDDIARAMSSISARISSQPGKTSLGIEIPNPKREDVVFGDLIDDSRFDDLNNSITLALGKDISGNIVYADLEKMPHLLIAGTTGSGKSVGINTIIMSILYRFKPDECKLILIDPKMLELSIYEDIPHLLTPVVTNPNKAVFALKWVVKEMENRYKLMSSLNVKNINSYNEKSKKILFSGKKFYRQVQTGIDTETRKPIFEKREIQTEKMPFIVVIIDEMADLMMVAGKEVENLVQRLAQMARASGIHLVTATQRPSVDVITGTIKANFPSRLSYKVASKFDSRTILNEMGAEQLLGRGDMLFLENGVNLKRLHGGFISENEIEKVVSSIKNQATFDQKNEISINENNEESSMSFKFEDGGVDALYSKAVDIVINQQKVSTSYIQRYLQIGYNRAARIVEKMEDDGIISEANNAGKRQVLKKS